MDLIARNQTTTGTGTILYLDGSAQAISVPSGKMMLLDIYTLGVRNNGSDMISSQDFVIISNVAGTTTIRDKQNIKAYTTGTYFINITANDTTDTLQIGVTGAAGQTVRWSSYITGLEMAWT